MAFIDGRIRGDYGDYIVRVPNLGHRYVEAEMKWFVTKAQYDLLYEQFERALKERDEYREEATRARDALTSRFGYDPVSAPVRNELATAAKEVEAYLSSHTFEDPGSGMIDESLVDALSQDPS